MSAAENRAKKYMKESAWMKFERLNELARHRWRCKHMKPNIDNATPHTSPHLLINQRRFDLEQEEGKKGEQGTISEGKRNKKDCGRNKGKQKGCCKKKDCGGKEGTDLKDDDWRINCGNKMRVIEKNLMTMKERVRWIHENYSLYLPKKRKYLCRGQAPWKPPPRPHSIDTKLAEIRKWSMRHHPKPKSAPAVSSGGWFCKPSEPEPSPAEVPSISSVTEEEAAKDPALAQLKEVQEAGDPNFQKRKCL